jgi:cyclopropane fatty-acyl-phospholipid synthase-like methyltransferase
MKQFSESCEQNKQPILEVLREYVSSKNTLLEIGSGTGQHAVFFAEQFPHLSWQTSDLPESHASIRAWMSDSAVANVLAPLELDVNQAQLPEAYYDVVYSANTTHIMNWPSVVNLFRIVGQCLKPGGVFCLYGPFNYDGNYTSASNAQFDQWLKMRDPESGIRDFEALQEQAGVNGMKLIADHAMPANNRILVWQKSE